ncbi:EFR1 family ferrodoxin [Anaerovorax sp. IOR16]|uniref:EFR1 family ferrodoxin n=1 Tax=Anaerovorax sp. IOR16 TaxID=2773458 RepID=UPI0019D037ED|nr:EFR1 family ferrodoxin [Anaerovorax sp. IOR16]
MNPCENKYNNLKIVYYTGTGCTEKVADCFFESFMQKKCFTFTEKITYKMEYSSQKHDFLLLIFPVHAMNAPDMVYQWIRDMDKVNGTYAAVISVSGGGEIIPNTACRLKSIKLLEDKGYHICYEKMLVMPSNCIIPTPESVAALLIQILPDKVSKIVEDILNGIDNRTTPYFIDRFFTFCGRIETYGAKWIGKSIQVTNKCSGCGWCSQNCPAGNITMKNGIPHFDSKCHLCLKCIYGCPNNALFPKIARSIIFKKGFDLKKISHINVEDQETDIIKLCKGNAWNGVKKYLSER